MATALQAITGQGSAGGSKKAPPAKVRKLEGTIERMRASANRNRQGAKAAGMEVIHVAEMQGAAFMTGMAAGYMGEDKVKLFGVNAPIGVGLAATGYGLYDTFQTGKQSGHVLALGNGVLAAGVTLAGARIGAKLAAERAAGKAPKGMAGKEREVTLSGKSRERRV